VITYSLFVVDDEESIRGSLSGALVDEGFKVQAAASAPVPAAE